MRRSASDRSPASFRRLVLQPLALGHVLADRRERHRLPRGVGQRQQLVGHPARLARLEVPEADLDLAVALLHHRRKELVHDPGPVLGEEEVLDARGARLLDALEPDQVQARPVDEERDRVQAADADEVRAGLDERDEFLPLGPGPLAVADVPRDLGRADDEARLVPDGRHRERDRDTLAVPADPFGLHVLDRTAGPQAGDDLLLLGDPVRRDDEGDVAADRLSGRVAEQPLRGRVPALHDSVQRLADDGVVRGLHDRRQQARRQQLAGPVPLQPPLRGHVAEDEDTSGDAAELVPDRCGGVVDRVLAAILVQQDRVVGEAHHGSLPERLRRRVLDRLPRLLVDDPEHRFERLAHRLCLRPAGQRLGHGVQVRDAAVDVRRHHRVADAAQRDLQQLLPLARPRLGRPHAPADRDDEGAGKEIGDQPDQMPVVERTQLAPGGNEQVGGRHVAEQGHHDGRTGSPHPHGRRDRPEQGDERQRVAQHRVEQRAKRHGRRQRGDRERVGFQPAPHIRSWTVERRSIKKCFVRCA